MKAVDEDASGVFADSDGEDGMFALHGCLRGLGYAVGVAAGCGDDVVVGLATGAGA